MDGTTSLELIVHFSKINAQFILRQIDPQLQQKIMQRNPHAFHPMTHNFPMVLTVSELEFDGKVQSSQEGKTTAAAVGEQYNAFYQSDVSFDVPRFVIPMHEYSFHRREILRFRLFMLLDEPSEDGIDDSVEENLGQVLIGEHICTMHEILGFRGRFYTRPLLREGLNYGMETCIMFRETPNMHSRVKLSISGTNIEKMDWLMGRSDPFVVISKSNEDGTDYVEVVRTEPVKRSINPRWKPIEVDMYHLCDGDGQRSLLFECFDYDPYGESELIGTFKTTMNQLKDKRASSFELSGNAIKQRQSNYTNCGLINIDKIDVIEQFSFLDLLRSGFELNMMVAIDFTASNGDVTSKQSKHYLSQDMGSNDYLKTILSLHYSIPSFNTTKLLYPYGFGAKVNPREEVSHCFHLTLDKEKPRTLGVKGISDVYRTALQQVSLQGPTIISEVISTAAELAQSLSLTQQYLTLFVLIDGEIDDLGDTVREIVNISSLPVSIVFVGIGDCEFHTLEFLEQKKALLHHNGRYVERNVVKFVRFNDHKDAGEEARLEAMLSHLPSQILEYARSHGIKPKPAPSVSPSQTTSASPMGMVMPSHPYMGSHPASQDSSISPTGYPPYVPPTVATPQMIYYPNMPSSPSPPPAPLMFNMPPYQGQQSVRGTSVSPIGFMPHNYQGMTYSMSQSPPPSLMPPLQPHPPHLGGDAQRSAFAPPPRRHDGDKNKDSPRAQQQKQQPPPPQQQQQLPHQPMPQRAGNNQRYPVIFSQQPFYIGDQGQMQMTNYIDDRQ